MQKIADFQYVTALGLYDIEAEETYQRLVKSLNSTVYWKKEEYLAWRSGWRDLYKWLSATIHESKRFRSPYAIMQVNKSASYEHACVIANARTVECREYSGLASRMMELRVLSKEKANISYLHDHRELETA